MAVTLEDARAAYAADEITLEEYELAIKDAVRGYSERSKKPPKDYSRYFKVFKSLVPKRQPKRLSRSRQAINTWTKGWSYGFVSIETIVGLSIMGHDILRHKGFTNLLADNMILAGGLLGAWLIISAFCYACTAWDW